MTEIASLDTYLRAQIQDRMDAILATAGTDNQAYVLDEALKRIESGVSQDFIKAYGGNQPSKQVDIAYDYRQMKGNYEASIIVNLGALTEDINYLGNEANHYVQRDTHSNVVENLPVQFDGDKYFVTTSLPVGEFIDSPGLSNVVDTNHLGTTTLYLSPAIQDFVGTSFAFTYVPLIKGDHTNTSGTDIGFQATESATITPISSNMNTLRCLNALLTYVLLTLRPTREQDDSYALQHIHREGVTTVDSVGVTTTDERPIYAIQYTVNAKTTYNVSYQDAQAVNKVVFKDSKGKPTDVLNLDK